MDVVFLSQLKLYAILKLTASDYVCEQLKHLFLI